MAKIEDLKQKLTKLETKIQKYTKKLTKLKQKVEEKAAKSKAKPLPSEQKTQAVKTPVALAPKKKGTITPEGRARLSALMTAKWAEKKKAEAQHTIKSSGKPEFKGA